MIPPRDPWAIAVLLVGLGETLLAGFVYSVRPRRFQNRILALILFADAAGWWLGVLETTMTAPANVFAAGAAEEVAWIVAFLSYMAFLGTLDTPLSRPLGRRSARVGLLVLGLGALVGLVGWTGTFFTGFATGEGGRLFVERGPAGTARTAATALGFLYAVAVAVWLYLTSAKESLERDQAKAYLAAFTVRDLSFALPILFGLYTTLQLPGRLAVLGYGVFAVLLAYGILKTQLFDIDLKLKLGVEKSTIVGAFGVAFLAVSEIAEALLGVEGTVYGVAGAVAIGLFFRQIEAGAERVADRLMPGVEDTEPYRQQRKREVYRASLEELMADEEITPKERRMLGRLQEELGLEGGEASRIEADMVEAGGGEPA